MKVEYKVREVTRFVVTRWHAAEQSEDETGKTYPGSVGSEVKGEFDNADVAYQVAYALCRDEHERLGYPLGDERVQYPEAPGFKELKSVTDAALVVGEPLSA